MALPLLTVGSGVLSGAAAGAAFGPIGAVIGGGIGLISGLFGASAEEEAAAEAKRQALRNKAIADMAAKDAVDRGEAAIGRHKLQVGQLQGRQRAALGASGVVGSEGSARDIQADTAGMAQLDQLTMRANAAREAWGFKMQGEGIMAQQRANEQRAEDSQFSEFIGAGANLAGSVYKNRYDMGLAKRPASGAIGGY